MLVVVHRDVHRLRQPVVPLELHVLDDPGTEPMPPARVDRELPADAAVAEPSFVPQPGLFHKFPPGRLFVGLTLVKAAGYGLPEFERLPAAQKERLAVVGGNDDEDGKGPAELSRHAACADEYRFPGAAPRKPRRAHW